MMNFELKLRTKYFALSTTFFLQTFYMVQAQVPFIPVPASFKGELVIPAGLKYDVIFREGDTIVNSKGEKTTAKGNQDYNAFIPLKGNDEGMMYTSHEINEANDVIGDGGGGTVYSIKKIQGHWKAGQYKAIDFSSVGGTYDNCSGTLTPKGTVFSTEEFPPSSNKDLYSNGKGFRDTSDFHGMKRHQHMGWVVEVDPVSGKALHKLYHMGRFSHEGAWAMPDKKTVYLADDYFPAVFFKFVAEKENDYTKGQLYAYQQSSDGPQGSWVALPMAMDSLIHIRDVALRMGATVFVRMEWMTYVNGKLYISETGADDFTMDKKKTFNGTPSYYLKNNFSKGENNYDYPYGAVVVFDPLTDELQPLIFGAKGTKDPSKHFSNPDGITHAIINEKSFLVINEDIVRLSKGRVDEKSEAENKWINEIWWLDLSNKNPSTDDLQRFMTAPAGCETTGGYFTNDASTYFVNIQHPSGNNSYPFNKSCTIAITGFAKKKDKNRGKSK